jgi:hypothetical protein
MRVRMLVNMTGTIDGKEWPERGGTIELADHVAADMVANRYAEPCDDDARDAGAPIETAVVNPVQETATRKPGRPRKV